MTFSDELVDILNDSVSLAKSLKHEFLTPEHILSVALNLVSVQGLIIICGADFSIMQTEINNYLKTQIPKLNTDEDFEPIQTEGFKDLLEQAMSLSFDAKKQKIDFSDVLVNMFNDERLYCCYVLKKGGLSKLHLTEVLSLS